LLIRARERETDLCFNVMNRLHYAVFDLKM
jgi:hypothetical protein